MTCMALKLASAFVSDCRFFVFIWANIIKYNKTDVKGYLYI